jgi:hypothetical protein
MLSGKRITTKGGDMTQWEYRIVDSQEIAREGLFRGRSREAIETFLNNLGREGWEIINMDWREFEGRMSFTGVAKRPRG